MSAGKRIPDSDDDDFSCAKHPDLDQQSSCCAAEEFSPSNDLAGGNQPWPPRSEENQEPSFLQALEFWQQRGSGAADRAQLGAQEIVEEDSSSSYGSLPPLVRATAAAADDATSSDSNLSPGDGREWDRCMAEAVEELRWEDVAPDLWNARVLQESSFDAEDERRRLARRLGLNLDGTDCSEGQNSPEELIPSDGGVAPPSEPAWDPHQVLREQLRRLGMATADVERIVAASLPPEG